MLRKKISPNHPIYQLVVSREPIYRRLDDWEILMPGDETACLSTLLNFTEKWIVCEWADGKTTVLQSLEQDADAGDRVYRRKI
jgi:hypothetical protein